MQLVHKVLREPLETREALGLQDRREMQETLVLEVLLVSMVEMVPQVLLEPLVRRVIRETLVHVVLMDRPETLEILETLVLQVSKNCIYGVE